MISIVVIIVVVVALLISKVQDKKKNTKIAEYEKSFSSFAITKKLESEFKQIALYYDEVGKTVRFVDRNVNPFHAKDYVCEGLGEAKVFTNAAFFVDKKKNNIRFIQIANNNIVDKVEEDFPVDKIIFISKWDGDTIVAVSKEKEELLICDICSLRNTLTNTTSCEILINRIKFKDIVSVELLEDSSTVFSKSTTRTVGGAVLGDIVAGGTGAMIGGLSGSSKQVNKIKTIVVKILIRDIEKSSISVYAYNGNVNGISLNTTSNDYKQFRNFADMVKDTISVIIDMEDKKENSLVNHSETPSNNFVAELAKLAKLRQEGMLTEDEYTVMKQQLIGNYQ